MWRTSTSGPHDVSPALTGTPTAPTPAAGTNTTQIATTAFVAAVDALKAPLASPALTGTPTAPTATPGTSTNQIATTAFVGAVDALKAPLASPALTGTPTAPTAAAGTNTTQLATTAFVKTALDLLLGAAPGSLDTLNELAAALGNDANFAATMTGALAAKAPLASPAFTGTPTGLGPGVSQALSVAATKGDPVDTDRFGYRDTTVGTLVTMSWAQVKDRIVTLAAITARLIEATAKVVPAAGDHFTYNDNDAAGVLKKLSWSQLKAALLASPAITGTPTGLLKAHVGLDASTTPPMRPSPSPSRSAPRSILKPRSARPPTAGGGSPRPRRRQPGCRWIRV